MITVNDKLKTFSEKIIMKVQEESDRKINEYSERNIKLLEKEKENTLKEAEALVEEAKRNAEFERQQVISKAGIDKEHSVLKKKSDIFMRVIEDIRKKSLEYTSRAEYIGFIESSIKRCLLEINSDEVTLFFRSDDLNRYKDKIEQIVNNTVNKNIKVCIDKTEEDILGGCICRNSRNTYRVDCSMRAVINDNYELIGKMLMDNL